MTLGVRVLIVEDVDVKFHELETAIQTLVPHATVSRAKSVVDAEDMVEEGQWSLIILDISMDIACGSAGPMRAGHANLGGMDVLERMYLLEQEFPTIIVTGFDYFPAGTGGDPSDAEMVSLADLEVRARNFIGELFLGCVRYGVDGWRAKFDATIKGWIKS